MVWCCMCSSRAADESAGWSDISHVDPVDVGRAAWARRRHCTDSRRLIRALLQRFAPATERTRHNRASGRVVSSGWSDARYRLSHPCLGQVGCARRERQHANDTSPHPGLRSEPTNVPLNTFNCMYVGYDTIRTIYYLHWKTDRQAASLI